MNSSQIEMTREQKILTKIAQCIIAVSVAMEFNEEVKHTPIYNKELKKRGNLFLKELEKNQKVFFDKILDASEFETDAIFNTQYDLIKELATLNVYMFDEVRQVVEAYKKEPKAIQGIVTQINKRQNNGIRNKN